MAAAEHILLESEERKVPHPLSSRKRHARVELRSPVRRRALELEIIDYCYLVVRTYRSQAVAAEYVLDLRFADPSITWSRHVAWRWLLAALSLALLGGATAWLIGGVTARPGWLATCGAVLGMAIAAAVVCFYRTTDCISMYSVNGRARLFEFTSGLGAKRAFMQFKGKLVAHIRFAIAARRPIRSEHLRDEMREHFRLRKNGVLSDEEYEESKARILAGHFPSNSPDGLTDRERRAARLAPDMQGGWY